MSETIYVVAFKVNAEQEGWCGLWSTVSTSIEVTRAHLILQKEREPNWCFTIFSFEPLGKVGQ